MALRNGLSTTVATKLNHTTSRRRRLLEHDCNFSGLQIKGICLTDLVLKLSRVCMYEKIAFVLIGRGLDQIFKSYVQCKGFREQRIPNFAWEFDRIISSCRLLDRPPSWHQNLVRGYFINARKMLTRNGEIHVTHKTSYPFSEWEIEKLEEAELFLVKEVAFYKQDYQGYKNKRGDGVCDESFPVRKSSTFIFAKRLYPKTQFHPGILSISTWPADIVDMACAYLNKREDLVYTARLAKEAERYDEVVEAMKKVLNLDVEIELSPEERNLLCVGHKNVVDALRLSWRALSSEELKEEAQGNKFYVEQLKKYRQKVASEISTICGDILKIVDGLIPRALDGESNAHYHKMKGDYYRYLAELKVGDEKQKAAAKSKEAYETATTVARAELPPTNHIRLGVALNFSTFYRQILNIPATAFWVAKIAFDEGVAEINGKLSSEQYLNCLSLLMQIRDIYHMKITSPPLRFFGYEKRIKHYTSSQKILLVGEGDFSFAVSLARAFGSSINMVATSLDSREALRVKYLRAMNNVMELERRGCVVLHEVDVHKMSQHPFLSYIRFDRIVYNLPHAGYSCVNHHRSITSFKFGKFGVQTNLMFHQDSMKGFFTNAREMLTEMGEIHVTHKTTYPFSEWEIVKLARQVGLYLLQEEKFSTWDYPGYENKRGAGLCDQTFPVGECSTFKFSKLLYHSIPYSYHIDLIRAYGQDSRINGPQIHHPPLNSLNTKKVKRIKHYSSNQKILLVGEGNFSFAACLAIKFGSAKNLVATSLDSKKSVIAKSSNAAPSNLKELEDRGCVILHGVNVHIMKQHHLLVNQLFDRIVFNFPHAGFIHWENEKRQIKLHQHLVRGFFASACQMLKVNGEVHVTHKTTYPFNEWEIVELAREAGLYLVEEASFSTRDYPGYVNKRGSGEKCNRTFPVGQCSTYKFAQLPSRKVKEL
ncbi:hypothetical protein ACLB2K_025552 [Fragaria x ananassa]